MTDNYYDQEYEDYARMTCPRCGGTRALHAPGCPAEHDDKLALAGIRAMAEMHSQGKAEDPVPAGSYPYQGSGSPLYFVYFRDKNSDEHETGTMHGTYSNKARAHATAAFLTVASFIASLVPWAHHDLRSYSVREFGL